MENHSSTIRLARMFLNSGSSLVPGHSRIGWCAEVRDFGGVQAAIDMDKRLEFVGQRVSLFIGEPRAIARRREISL